METYQIKLLEITSESSNTKTFYFEKPAGLHWEEGAHCHIKLLDEVEQDASNRKMVRHMSIMTLPYEEKLAITTRIPGSGSEFKTKLNQLHIRDQVLLFKIGSRMALRRMDQPIVLLSMGVAIATMRPLIHAFAKDSCKIPSLIHINVDSSKDNLFYDELSQLKSESLQLMWIFNRTAFYESLNQVMMLENPIYYVAGSDEFIKDVTFYLLDKGVSMTNIVLDKRESLVNEMLGAYHK